MTRLQNLDSSRADRWRDRAKALADDLQFVDSAPFPPVQDGDIIGMPHGCHLEQMSWIRPRHHPHDAVFFVLRSAWETLPAVDRVVALIHLIVYEEMIKFGAPTADDARLFAAMIAADRFQGLSSDAYLDLWTRFSLNDFPITLGGACVQYRTRELSAGGVLLKAFFCGPRLFKSATGR